MLMSEHKEIQLKDRDVIPTREVLEQVLKDSYIAYESFQDTLIDLDMEQDWMWYTPHKIWCAKGQYFWSTPRGTRKEKVLYWLNVSDGFFNVTVWFKEKNRSELLLADLSAKTKKIIHDTKSIMNESTFPVMCKVITIDDLIDIYTLIKSKKQMEAK